MATPVRISRDKRLLGDLLMERGLVSRSSLESGLEEQRARGGRLGYNLMKLGGVTPASFHLFLKENLGSLSPELAEAIHSAPAIDLIPANLAYHYCMLPIRVEDGVLDLAIATADHESLIQAVSELTGLRVEPLVCPPATISEALGRSYPDQIEPGVFYRNAGDNLFVLSDRRRGLRPLLPEAVHEDAPASHWLRAIGTESIRRGAPRIRIEVLPTEMRAMFEGNATGESGIGLPLGAYPGLAALLEGLSGIAARGRVVPREGRIGLRVEGRSISASVLALPALEGEAYILNLRDERRGPILREEVQKDAPALRPALRRIVGDRRGLLVVAGPGTPEASTGMGIILDLLGDALPLRVAVGDWPPSPLLQIIGSSPGGADEPLPISALLEQALSSEPDLLVLPDIRSHGILGMALALARSRVVVAAVRSVDAFAAVEWLARSGHHGDLAESAVGILGTRWMERLCNGCRRAFDLQDLLSPAPRHLTPAPGPYYANQGCGSCRGSGTLNLEAVFEFLPVEKGDSTFHPTTTAAALREERFLGGTPTVFQAALRRASTSTLDVREPLRYLLHEQF